MNKIKTGDDPLLRTSTILMAIFVLLYITMPLYPIELVWEAVSDANLLSYQIYIGTESGCYSDTIDVGNTLTYTLDDLDPGCTYFLAICAYDTWGNYSGLSSEITCMMGDVQSEVAKDRAEDSFDLFQNYPNPFNPITTIEYSIRRSGRVRMIISNSNGATVRTLFDRNMPHGRAAVQWDGRDDHGLTVASGVYFCTFEQKSNIQIRRMTLLRAS